MEKPDRMTVVGAALGGAAGALAGRLGFGGRGAALGAALGSAVGSACALKIAKQREPWWHDAANVRTFDDVAREDAAFKEASQALTVDAMAEADALTRLMVGTSAAALADACGSLNAMAKLDAAKARWQPWADSPKLGEQILAVTTDLDAPHLLPTGIEQRLLSGVKAASFGLFALLQHAAFDPPSQPLRMVAVDMDGTFLNSNGTVSPRNKALASTLVQSGVEFVIATGRPAKALQPIIDGLGLQTLPAVTFNGACLQQAHAGKASTLLWQQPLPSDLTQRIINLVSGPTLNLALSYSCRTKAICLVTTAAHKEQLAEYERLEMVKQDIVVESVDGLMAAAKEEEPPLKIVGFSADPSKDAATARRALQGLPVHVIAAEMHIEFLCEGVNKAEALRRLCEIKGMDMRSVVAFGDGNNDAEMLQASGYGIAMSNAREAAKEAADEVLVLSNDSDGVSVKCEELVQEGRLGG